MPVDNVSRIIKESEYKTWSLPERYTTRALSRNDYSQLKTIGMDETSKRKGHDCITLFVDLDQRKIIFITKGKDHKTVKAFVNDLRKHKGTPEHITNVSCDMSPAFIKGIVACLPDAEITFDRFHLMKILNVALDQVRKQEVIIQSIRKGHRYIFLKNESNVTAKQHNIFQGLSLSKLNLKSIRALHIRENFQEIYKAESYEQFKMLLKKWYFWATHSRIEQIKQAAYTIKNHWQGVVQWKKSQIDNGLLEGLNSLIQAAKSKARGFRNTRYFKIIAFLVTGNLNFTQFNEHYLPT